MEQPVSCAAMRNGVIFRLITTSPTNNHGGFAADDLRSPRRPVEKGPCPTSDHPSLRLSRSVGLHGSGFSDRNPFCICAGRADGVDGRPQRSGKRRPGPRVPPSGRTSWWDSSAWLGVPQPRSSSGYTATVPTPVRKRRGIPAFDHNQLATSPLDTSSPFARRHHRCRLSMVNLSQGEPRTPLLRGEPRIRCIPVSVQLTES